MTVMACDTTRRVPWPSELGYTRLTMLLRAAYADTPCDEDEEPDALAPQGDVILTWNAPWFRYRPSDGGPVQGWGARSVVCQILPDGTIAPPESTATSDGSVIVMPTVHELLEPSGSTITANIRLTTPGPQFAPISFQAKPGTTVNILAEADMGKQPGVIVKPIVTEDTAVRAEAAALRAEQAAAGVADIGEQVEQVQAYTTRAETAASSAETAASNAETAATNAEAASAEAATVTTDAAYIRDVIAQHGTLKGDPGPAPSIEWQGDRLSVNGELGPSLTGAPGRDGGPVPVGGTAGQVVTRTEDGGVAWTDVAGGDGLNIVGPGRPDQPGTTGLLIDGSETVGTTYTSTDGAGVGAWVWRKRPNGWVVVDGDTGVRDVTTDVLGAEGICTIQRVGSMVTFTTGKLATNYNQLLYTVPEGFLRTELIQGGQLLGATVISSQASLTNYMVTHPLLLSLRDQVKFHGQNIGTAQIGSASIVWRSYHPWPIALPGTPFD